MTNEQHFTIKPLAWEKFSDIHHVATSIFGDIRLTYHSGDAWFGLYIQGAYVKAAGDTLEAAQAVAEAWYRERLATALEVVT